MIATRTMFRGVLLGCLGLLAACEDTGLQAYNDSGSSEASGSIEERLTLTPAGRVEFGKVSTDGTSTSQELVLTNIGSSQLPLIDVYMDEFTASAFYLPDPLPLPLILKPGAAFTLNVFFKPYAASEFKGTVILELDDGSEVFQAERDLLGFGCDEGQPPSNGGC